MKEANSPSLPVLPTSNRKTWDVPKKDPYYAVLMDPFKRSHSVEPKSEGYEPSFGSALRGKESSGHHRETYLKDLDEQVEGLTEQSVHLSRWRRNVSVEPGRRRREGRTGGRGEAPPWSARGLIQVRQVSQIEDFKNVDAQLQCEGPQLIEIQMC